MNCSGSYQNKGVTMTRSERAVSKFVAGYNCAQSVFYAFSDDLKIDQDTGLKIACGFGAGMGRQGEVCGAVTGGIMVLGARCSGCSGKTYAPLRRTILGKPSLKAK